MAISLGILTQHFQTNPSSVNSVSLISWDWMGRIFGVYAVNTDLYGGKLRESTINGGCSIQKWEIHQEERCFLTVLDAIAPVSTNIGIVKFPIDKWFSVKLHLDRGFPIHVWLPEGRTWVWWSLEARMTNSVCFHTKRFREDHTYLLLLCSMLLSMEAEKRILLANSTHENFLKTCIIFSIYIYIDGYCTSC